MNKKKRFNDLTHIEKCEIYNMTISCLWFMKEILDKFNITYHTHRKVMNEFEHFLRTGNPRNL